MLLINQNNFVNHKILNQEFYGKFFIRSLNFENKNIYILDNNYLQFNSVNDDFKKFIFTKKSKLGHSLSVDTYDYKNNLNNFIVFKSYFLSQKYIITNYTQNFLKSINILFKNIKNSKFLFLTNPNKGGFVCYSYGLIGFIPKNHCNFFLIKFLNYFKNSIKKNNNNIIDYLTYLNKLKSKYFIFNIYSKYFILNIQSFYSTLKLLKKSKRKKKLLNKNFRINFLFLIKN